MLSPDRHRDRCRDSRDPSPVVDAVNHADCLGCAEFDDCALWLVIDGASCPDRLIESKSLGDVSHPDRTIHGASIRNGRVCGPEVLRALELELSMLCRKCGRKLLSMSEKLEAQMTGGLCSDCVGAKGTEALE